MSAWVTKRELLQALRIGKTREAELRKELIFRPGTHYRRVSDTNARTSPLLYDLDACEQTLRDKAAADANRFETYD